MRRKILSAVLAATLAVSGTITAFAGEWKLENGNWKYLNDDSTYSTSTWQWIDGNSDGLAESYYFDANGICLINTITPDHYSVDASGAWTVNGYVQSKNIATGEVTSINRAASAVDPISLVDLKPVDKSGYNKFTEKATATGEVWDNGFFLHSSRWARFFPNQKYNTLEMTFAPQAGTYDGRSTQIKIYDEKENPIYVSDLITNMSSPQTVTVDISGLRYFKIVNSDNNSGGVYVLFKDCILR